MDFIKRFFESKMLRLALFAFMFFFIFKIIDHILIFFNINQEMGYIYFMWFTVLFLLFVLLPIDKSYFLIFNKVPTATTPNTNSSRHDGRGGEGDDGRGGVNFVLNTNTQFGDNSSDGPELIRNRRPRNRRPRIIR